MIQRYEITDNVLTLVNFTTDDYRNVLEYLECYGEHNEWTIVKHEQSSDRSEKLNYELALEFGYPLPNLTFIHHVEISMSPNLTFRMLQAIGPSGFHLDLDDDIDDWNYGDNE